ncbi:uncharacterized protein LOC129575130 [Sitodiplosis mosellana]|uniref:uncharacterized protein LOC129575130 n=1 Tax=Sitodiplosis mosellana TaxID=263140 RepID=UPI002443CE2B|nr:uncharacterized protein LOC129575130 [Sitodiplosis mosellana]
MCNNKTKFGKACRLNPRHEPLSDDDRKLILELVNNARSDHARGKVTYDSQKIGPFKDVEAAKMIETIWSDEDEMISLNHAVRCTMKPDKCHRTAFKKFAGQNLGVVCRSAHYTVKEVINEIVHNGWRAQCNNYPQNTASWMQNFPTSRDLAKKQIFPSTVENYATLMIEDNFSMGCSIVRDELMADDVNSAGKLIKKKVFCSYMTCNFARSIVRDNITNTAQVYEKGKAQSKCGVLGHSMEYKGLCGPIDPQKHSFDELPIDKRLFVKETWPENEAPPVKKWKKLNKVGP